MGISNKIIDGMKALTAATPGRLKVSLALLLAGTAGFTLASSVGTGKFIEAYEQTGKAAVPAYINTQKLRATLSDVQASAANELVGRPGENTKTAKNYGDKMQESSQLVIGLSIGANDVQKTLVEKISADINLYNAYITQARQLHVRDDAAYLAAYRRASALMSESLIPNAEKLAKIHNDRSQEAYGSVKAAAGGVIVAFFLSGGLLLGVLVNTQLYMRERMRRIVNPFLFGASGITAVIFVIGGLTLSTSAFRLGQSQATLFAPISQGWAQRTTAYELKGLQSARMLDKPLKAQNAAEFNKRVSSLKTMPFGQQLNGFLTVDSQIEQLERDGNHARALAKLIGHSAGESNYAFNAYDQELTKKVEGLTTGFSQLVDQELNSLVFVSRAGQFLVPFVGLLSFLGIRKRLDEYKL